jgi:hypothetical protein
MGEDEVPCTAGVGEPSEGTCVFNCGICDVAPLSLVGGAEGGGLIGPACCEPAGRESSPVTNSPARGESLRAILGISRKILLNMPSSTPASAPSGRNLPVAPGLLSVPSAPVRLVIPRQYSAIRAGAQPEVHFHDTSAARRKPARRHFTRVLGIPTISTR